MCVFVCAQGFLERTYLFYGYYKLEFIHSRFTYNLPLAYLLATISYLLLSLVWIVKRSDRKTRLCVC